MRAANRSIAHDLAKHTGKLRPSQIWTLAHSVGNRSRNMLIIKHSFNNWTKLIL